MAILDNDQPDKMFIQPSGQKSLIGESVAEGRANLKLVTQANPHGAGRERLNDP